MCVNITINFEGHKTQHYTKKLHIAHSLNMSDIFRSAVALFAQTFFDKPQMPELDFGQGMFSKHRGHKMFVVHVAQLLYPYVGLAFLAGQRYAVPRRPLPFSIPPYQAQLVDVVAFAQRRFSVPNIVNDVIHIVNRDDHCGGSAAVVFQFIFAYLF